MKRITLFLMLLILSPGICPGADVYQWKDEKGVLHFTDDLKNVPERYRDKVQARDLGPDEAAKEPAPPPRTQPVPSVQGRVSSDTWGGHTGLWWRNRFDTMRTQIAALQQGLTAKEQRLSEARRERRIFQRSRDRVTANEIAAEIDRDQAKIIELREALATLQQEANRVGLPAEWR